MQYTAYTTQHTSYSIKHTAYSIYHTVYNIQRTAYSVQHPAYNMQHTAFSVRVIRIQRTSDTSVDITFRRLLCVANSKFQIWGSSLQVQKDLCKSSQHISSSSLLSLRCSPRMRAARRFSHSELGSAAPRSTRSQRRLESCCPRHFAEGRQNIQAELVFSMGSEASYTQASGAPSRN